MSAVATVVRMSDQGEGDADQSTGAKLRARRIGLGLTQRRVAQKAGIRHEQLSRIELGHVEPSDVTLSKIRMVLEQYEHRYGVTVTTSIELPDGSKVTFAGPAEEVAAAMRAYEGRD